MTGLTRWSRVRSQVPLVAVVGALALAAPAVAQPGPPPPPPLPTGSCPLLGSSFQGGDGNQNGETAVCEGVSRDLRDWETIRDSPRLHHNPDHPLPAAGSEFGPNTDEREPGDWTFITESTGGVSPGASDIQDGWSYVGQPDGDTFLYLGFTRGSSTGTNQINVELNHDPDPWVNPRGAEIPCRRDGDLIIGFLPKGNDPEVGVRLYSWNTATTATGGRPCALTGTWTPYGDLPEGSAQGTMNAGPITNLLRDGDYAVDETMAARTFGEAALDLTRLLTEVIDRPCFSFGLISMHSHSSDTITSALKDWVKPRPLTVRRCSAAGTKYFDRNANGRRDPGEPPLANWRIWADYPPFNGRWDSETEPFAITDEQGEYVLNNIRPPDDGTYMLRETLLRSARVQRLISNEWRCSEPAPNDALSGRFRCAHGPIDVETTPYAQDRDFGNWLPAAITVRKRHFPPENPGQFRLLVGDTVVLNFPEEGSSRTVFVRPGRYRVSEEPVPPTDLSQYEEARVHCRRTDSSPGQLRHGPVYQDLRLRAGQRATCTFTNVRLGEPAIAITKSARPRIVMAGHTITYTLEVSNPGRVSFPAAAVDVTDSRCDHAPELVDKQHLNANGERVDDDTPGTLDRDDVWVYRCTHRTPAAGADCQVRAVTNTAGVEATAPNREPVSATDDAEVTVLCPDQPIPPGPEPPGPQPPPDPELPVERPGPQPPTPAPPDADAAGQAGVAFRRAIRRCIAIRVPRVNFTGTKVARIAVFVNGRLRRNLTVQALRRRVTPRVTVAPGRRYRIAVRVTFQRGSGTPPATLRGTFRTCAVRQQRPPAVTG